MPDGPRSDGPQPDGPQPRARPEPALADYAFLSDCQTAALVARDGGVDWWCPPRFDAPSVLGRVLDPGAGHWALHPSGEHTSERAYVEGTLVLRTVLSTATGSAAVTDALALSPGARGHDLGLLSPQVLLRRVEGLHGVVELETELVPRTEYGRTTPLLRPLPGGGTDGGGTDGSGGTDGGGVEARGGPVRLTCTGAVPWRCEDGAARATFSVAAGERVDLSARYSPSFGAAPVPYGQDGPTPTVDDTVAAWQSWSALHTRYEGAFRDEVRRSALVLQGLTYQPSGAVIAAATTSLPEQLGGELNFDYRYAWLRDLSLTARALWIAACPDEPGRLFDWFATATGELGDELVQIMYGVEGERDLSEHALDHLAGYAGSRPVRVGNDAWRQVQLDVLGEVLDAAHLLRDTLGDLDVGVQRLLVALADRAARDWTEPDAGMWEARDRQRHYTSSKVMCWVALDRAVRLAPRLGPTADPDRWAAARDEVRAAVLEQAWSEPAGAYTGAFGSDELDASVLILPLVGFLPADDPRMWATVSAVERELGTDWLVRRWAGDTSGFVLCAYWLSECLALAGEVERAGEWFERTGEHRNDVGLLTEEVEPGTGAALGNLPQAFSHVGHINAAWRISQARQRTT